MLSLNKFKTEEVPVVGTENIYSFNSLSDTKELYFVYFNTSHQRRTRSFSFLHLVAVMPHVANESSCFLPPILLLGKILDPLLRLPQGKEVIF